MVQVQDETSAEVVYTLRIRGEFFTPLVRQPGVYSVLVYDPDGDYYKTGSVSRARRKG